MALVPSIDALAARGVVVAAGAIGAMLLASGVDKLRRHDDFLGTLAAYRIVPDAMIEPAAWTLGAVEVLLGAGYVIGMPSRLLGAAGLALFSVFALAMAFNILRGRTNLSCGCVPGLDGERLTWAGVGRAALCAVLSLALPLGDRVHGIARVEDVMGGACLFVLIVATALLSPRPAGTAA
ncbi:methylamine utilization protein MauE [Ameyamaea chiangmaiensis NBRC 103196]|uniref:Methylamine utilization protein MauE n=1 Tax=Ameyamaea chiangmaiensis TaxID=442969 RepID=A0A850P8Y5_9PROT|nr:MauE/DoxX family redox-associated membrane protein [Ameyamaea chiangmaiensis]MBS4073574.1 DoxX family membrane protein [Ameyamaea chiangmaiensis]NVN40454.1 DoxX family membrane protein [Ameyamaea chiangmaiensis]GBQ69206.1 methylamine utilization protein MauE [Ameyamaea chiangmaiensis NBRC 103196]